MVGLGQAAALAYVDVEGNLVVPEAHDAFLAVGSIRDEVVFLWDPLEVHQDVQVGHVEVPDRVVQADHHEIAFQEVYAGRDPVQVDLAEADLQVHWVLEEVLEVHLDAVHSMVLVDNQVAGLD